MKKAIPIAVILIGLGAYVYFFHVRPARQYDPIVRGYGTVEVTDVIVSPKIAAHIQTIAADEGDKVASGDVLVTLQCADIRARLAQAEAQVRQAETAVEQAKAAKDQAAAAKQQANANVQPYLVGKDRADREYRRAMELGSLNSISKQAVDEAQTEVEAADKRIAAAQEGVVVFKKGVKLAEQSIGLAQAQVDLAKTSVDIILSQLEECTLRAPVSGTVMRRNYEPGEMALPGAAVLKIARLDDVYTWIYVPNEEVGRVRLGQQVRVSADTYPGREFTGKVVRINEEAEFTPKSIQTKEDRTQLVYGVKVALDNADGALMSGMPIEARLVDDNPPGRRPPTAGGGRQSLSPGSR